MKESKAEYWENKGFILLHRSALNNPALHSNPNRWSVWTHLLMFATHSEMRKEFDGQTIILKSGQLLTGLLFLSKETGISKNSVDRILKWLETERQVGQKITYANRLITITNWNKYQSNGTIVGKRVGNEWETSGKRVGTYNKVEKEKNENKGENKSGPPTTINQLRAEKNLNGSEGKKTIKEEEVLDLQDLCDRCSKLGKYKPKEIKNDNIQQ